MGDVVRVSVEDIERAARLIEGVAVRTPMEESRWLSALTGSPVLLKCENLQRTGSFKVRGAYTRMWHLSEEERARGVVAASAGNHAQGVALAAQFLGIKATVFMPEGAPIPKEKATRGYGADVVFHGRYLEDALVAAREFQEQTGAVLIHPFDSTEVVAGQGTVGLEIVEQAPDVETVVVPCGGGGSLAGGSALAIKAKRPDVTGDRRVQADGGGGVPSRRCQLGVPPGGAPLDDHHGRRDRRGPAGRGAVRRSAGRRRRDHHGVRGVAVTRGAGDARAGEDGGGAGRCGSRGRDPRRSRPLLDPDRGGPLGRQHRPAPAGQGDPARHGGGRSLPQPHPAHPRPPRWSGPAALGGRRSGRQRDRGRARPDQRRPVARRGRGAPASSRRAASHTPRR